MNSEQKAEKAKIRVDVCVNCGDIVVEDGVGYWSHYRGPGSRLNRCQHTVAYGYDATPTHDGDYFRVAVPVAKTERDAVRFDVLRQLYVQGADHKQLGRRFVELMGEDPRA